MFSSLRGAPGGPTAQCGVPRAFIGDAEASAGVLGITATILRGFVYPLYSFQRTGRYIGIGPYHPESPQRYITFAVARVCLTYVTGVFPMATVSPPSAVTAVVQNK